MDKHLREFSLEEIKRYMIGTHTVSKTVLGPTGKIAIYKECWYNRRFEDDKYVLVFVPNNEVVARAIIIIVSNDYMDFEYDIIDRFEKTFGYDSGKNIEYYLYDGRFKELKYGE